jgi:hypothetical protein
MHECDTVLKALLQCPQTSILERITGARIDHWLNVEFPEVQQTRVDLLGEPADNQRVIGLELQSANDAKLPLRMAEYALQFIGCMSVFPNSMYRTLATPKCGWRRNLRARIFIAVTS